MKKIQQKSIIMDVLEREGGTEGGRESERERKDLGLVLHFGKK